MRSKPESPRSQGIGDYISPKRVTGSTVNLTNGGQFRTLPIYDLSRPGNNSYLNEPPVDVEKLTEDLKLLVEDSRPYRRSRRR